MKLGSRHASIAARVPQADLVGFLCECFQRVLTRGVQLEGLCDEWAPNRVDINAMGRPVVDLADVRDAREVALGTFLCQALADFFRQVVDVVFGHRDFDVVHQFVG